MSFWEHLDVFRGALIRILVVTVVFAVAAFCFKTQLFDIVLAPANDRFVTYRWLGALAAHMPGAETIDFHISLINTGLAEQFLIHMQTAFYFGLLCASPYILFQLFRFVSPGLYADERRYAVRMVGSAYVMFCIGLLVSYFLIFPLTFRFLGTYQVAGDVANMITLQSYMSTLLSMSLAMGIVFEMPVLAWLLGRMGLLTRALMRKYRRHAIVLILIVAAIITPTSDIFTLLVVSIPMCLLYELSVRLVPTK